MKTMTILSIVIILLTYLISSISIAILICKILNFPDPRKYGSHNPGTTNIFRIAGIKIAVIVLLFDTLKGAIPIWLSYYYLHFTSFYLEIIAISSCIGHMYPIFFKFHGGKGVATTFGALTIIGAKFSLIMITSWILIALFFRYISLASILTTIIISYYSWYSQSEYLFAVIIISFLIITKHTKNIKRLWKNQEKKIWS